MAIPRRSAMIVLELIVGLSLSAFAALFVGYPLLLRLLPARRVSMGDSKFDENVTILVAVRNGASLIGRKIENALALDWPPERLEVIVSSDGSTDGTEEVVRTFSDERVRLVSHAEHEGKSAALARGVAVASGDVIVFTDADAMFEREVLRAMMPWYDSPTVGGVCGERVVGEEDGLSGGAQQGYISADSGLKRLEARVGSLTSNDGKIYSVRRDLCRPIPKNVNDDLYQTLAVVDAGFRFVFEPGARARVRVPSRDWMHELSRRRRISARGLQTVLEWSHLLSPSRGWIFAVGLFVNRVLRRLLPVFAILLLLSSAGLASWSALYAVLFGAQVLFYSAAGLHGIVPSGRIPGPISRFSGFAFYFTLGMLGSLLGLVDFLGRRQFDRWETVDTSAEGSRVGSGTRS